MISLLVKLEKPETLQGVCDDIGAVISALGVTGSRTDEKISREVLLMQCNLMPWHRNSGHTTLRTFLGNSLRKIESIHRHS